MSRERIVVPAGRRISTDAFAYLIRQVSVIPTYVDVVGSQTDEAALRVIVAKYPVTEWVSFLSRIQTMLAGSRINDHEYRKRVFWGALGPRVRAAIDAYSTGLTKQGARVGLFYERQLATLQQYAILHAPEYSEGKLENDDGRDDLGFALLMVAELMMRRGGDEGEPKHNLECRIHDQIRMSLLPVPTYAGRAFKFYELASDQPGDDLRQYLSLFEAAAGVNARDFILGGLAVALHEENRLFDNQYEGWGTVPAPEQCPNPREADCVRAYLAVRCKPLAEIRSSIKQLDAARPLPDWNLISLAASPLVDLGAIGKFTLNLTAVGRSLFDGVRHTILTATREQNLPSGWNDLRRIGGLYGRIFEQFVGRILEKAFPGRVTRIATDTEERADYVIAFGTAAIVLEVKAEHFIGLKHASFMTLEERKREIENVGITKATSQIAATIKALRAGHIQVSGLNPDWTITPIVPVIVTEERLPQVRGSWEALYAPLIQPLDELRGAGPVAPVRLLTIDDLEYVPDIKGTDGFGAICLKWANDPDLKDSMLPTYLSARGIEWRNDFVLDQFTDVMLFLADRLDLDVQKLRDGIGHERRRAEERGGTNEDDHDTGARG